MLPCQLDLGTSTQCGSRDFWFLDVRSFLDSISGMWVAKSVILNKGTFLSLTNDSCHPID